MKTMLLVIGILLILVGVVWILQGINILPGSFMTGQSKWAVYGGISAIVGIALLVYSSRRSAPRP